jgi:hypothetical protein
MQRKVVLSCIVPYNQLYVMTKCNVMPKAFTGIRVHTRWNWAWAQSRKSPYMALGCTQHKCYCGYMLSETQFCHDTKFYWVLCYHGFMLSKTWYHGKKNSKKEGEHSLKWRKQYA